MTTTDDTTFTATRKSMHAQTTTHDATPETFTVRRRHATRTRKPMHAETATHETASRHFTFNRVRPARVVEAEHVHELRASQLTSVAVEELEWFFTSTETDGSALHARATIEAWLVTLAPSEQQAITLRFDATPWPESMQAAGLESGYALAVSLVSVLPWRATDRPYHEIHRRAGEHLEAAVRERGVTVMRGISRRADWDFANAVRVYAKARGRTPSVLPRRVA